MAKVVDIHEWLKLSLNQRKDSNMDQPWDTKAEFKKHVSDQVYHALESAGDLCRLRCHDDPDLLDSIAEGLGRFLDDGDVFDQVLTTFMTLNPEYVGKMISRLEDDTATKILQAAKESE